MSKIEPNEPPVAGDLRNPALSSWWSRAAWPAAGVVLGGAGGALLTAMDLPVEWAVLVVIMTALLTLVAAFSWRQRVLSRMVADLRAKVAEAKAAEQRQAATAAQAAALLKEITDAIPYCVSKLDADLRIVFANRVAEQWFHTPPDRNVGQHVTANVGPDVYRRLRPTLEKALQGEEQYYQEFREFPDGTTRDVVVRYIPERREDGSIGGMYTMINDISDLVTAQEEIERRGRRQQMLSELGKLALSSPDLRSVFVMAAEKVAAGLGTRYVVIGEFQSGERQIELRYRYGFPQNSDVRSPVAPVDGDSMSALAFREGRPVVSLDFQHDSRFGVSPGARINNIRCGLSVPIPGSPTQYGVLNAYHDRPLEISEDEVHFVESVANLLADAVVRRRSEETLYREKERAQVTLASIADAVIATGAQGHVDFMNPVAERLTGWPRREGNGRHVAEVVRLIDDATLEPVLNPVLRAIELRHTVQTEEQVELVARDGSRLAIDASAAPIRAKSGEIVGAVLVFRDVSEKRQLARQLSHQATHDALTGLINRFEFERRLVKVLGEAATVPAEHALLYLDLDQFKVVNDTCGHTAGDELLRQLTAVLQERMRKRDTLARLGGDEFAVLLEFCPPQRAESIAADLKQAVHDFRFGWDGRIFRVGVSIGLINFGREPTSLAQVLSAADTACYLAKEQGRNRIQVYHLDDQALSQRHGEMHWVSRLQQAIEEQRFCLYAQPIAPLIEGLADLPHVEVLVRLYNEDGELVPPGAFLPAAERYNLMLRIDRWVVEKTLETIAHFRAQPGFRLPMCGINLSGASLGDDSLLPFIRERMLSLHIPADSLCFEVTETAAITNLVTATQLIRELRDLGCHFALDDFGSGMSSFAYLKNLSVDFLKIDGNFVKDIEDDPVDWVMVEAINRIGQVMGIRTIAEYAENDAIIAKLRALGVDYAQGYGIAMPRPFEEVLMAVQNETPGTGILSALRSDHR